MALETYPDVPNEDVGTTVQNYIDAGAKKVTVIPNDDEKTCTVVVKT